LGRLPSFLLYVFPTLQGAYGFTEDTYIKNPQNINLLYVISLFIAMLVKRVLNPTKKNKVIGNTFHLIFLGTEAVLFDSLWDEPIIYGNKNLVRIAISDPKKLVTLLDTNVKEIIVYLYRIQDTGELKKHGPPLKGKPTELIVPNY
jgi:hypothetical protein